MTDSELIQRIKDALNTDEDGLALVEVARNACKAELELAYIKMGKDESMSHNLL